MHAHRALVLGAVIVHVAAAALQEHDDVVSQHTARTAPPVEESRRLQESSPAACLADMNLVRERHPLRTFHSEHIQ